MKYLLVIGFACDVYRREPRARIFVGDRLMDEFLIFHTPSNLWTAKHEFLKNLHPLQPYAFAEMHNLCIKNYPPLKFYELEVDDEVYNLDIRIDIDNYDSNYSNGYMTRSTLLRLEVCHFFPLDQKLLLRLDKIKVRRRNSENYSWYLSMKNRIFDLVMNGVCWQGANGQKITSNPSIVLPKYDIGGDGAFVCELTKRYGILIPPLARASRHSFDYAMTSYFFDKYFYHAH